MARHPGEPPAVREDGINGIEIDQRRGKWPFIKAMWGEDSKGRTRLVFIADCNEGGQVVGANQGIAIIAVSKKKARRLAEWILKTIDEIPD